MRIVGKYPEALPGPIHWPREMPSGERDAGGKLDYLRLVNRYFRTQIAVENKAVSRFIGVADASGVDEGHVASASTRHGWGIPLEGLCVNLEHRIKAI